MPSTVNYDAPCASTEEDLPGFIPFKKNTVIRRYSTLTRAWNDVRTSLVLIFLISHLIVVEGCLPSWFRQVRTEPQSLEANKSITNEIDDPPEVLETAHSTKQISEHPRSTHHQRAEIGVIGDGNEIEELDMIYGTAAPIRMDNKLEEARRHHSKYKCKGWCYRGGNCTVDIDEVTYKLRSINCHCPHGYWGRRCELHFVARLFAPVKGHVEVEKSGVSAFAFIILMLIVTIGLIFYTYRKIVRRNAPFNSTTLLSLNHHLRRPTMSFQAMPNSAVNTTPSSSTAYLNRFSNSQYFNCRTPFSPLSRSYGQLTGNSHQSFSDLSPSLSMAFGRLSISSSRLHQHPDMRPFKFLGRASSCIAQPVSDMPPSPDSHTTNQTAYYTVRSTMTSDQSMNVNNRYDGQRSVILVEAPVTVHEPPQ